MLSVDGRTICWVDYFFMFSVDRGTICVFYISLCFQLTEGRFVGSIYVGGEEERSEGQRDKSNSWRVKL